MDLARIACKYVDVPVPAALSNGEPATLPGVDVAIVPAGESPNTSTTWAASEYAAGAATVMLAGPHATNPPPAAIVLTDPGGDLWARVVDQPETDAAMIER